jgi:hypothetical protein
VSLNQGLAISQIQLSIDEVLFPQQQLAADKAEQLEQMIKQWRLDELKIDLDLSSSPVSMNISLARLNLQAPYQHLKQLQIQCTSFVFSADNIQCDDGIISLKGLLKQDVISRAKLYFKFIPKTSELIISLKQLKVKQGLVNLSYHQKKSQWTVSAVISQLNYLSLKPYMDFHFKKTLAEFDTLGGLISVSGQLNSDPSGQLKSMKLKGDIDDFHYSQGENLAEKLNLDFTFKGRWQNNQAYYDIAISNITGELFQNNIYINFQGNEQISTALNLSPQSIKLNNLNVTIPKLVKLNAEGSINTGSNVEIESLSTTFQFKDLSRFNELYLVDLLEGTDYEGLQLQGGFSGQFDKKNEQLSLNTSLKTLSLKFREQIELKSISGALNWDNHPGTVDTIAKSHLHWEQVVLNHLPFGPTDVFFKMKGDQMKILEEVDIPFFDGFLQLNSLALDNIGAGKNTDSGNDTASAMTVTLDGMIKPVSLALVSNHFGWPVLDGQLSAVIPHTTYNERQLKVGGAMMLQVFDGNIIVKDLTVEQPLSESARFYANIDMNNLNLKSLTKTYNFGEIEGRVEGKFKDLILDSWKPVQFDAYIRTPDNDRSSHKISQRAIDNLSSLGGASGILSRSFLSFFETFRYNKLGLSCKLKNNVCTMDGVESKNGNGYYIVKGGGIPRIDVMGFERQVNWEVLTSRLQAIQMANEAVIE